MPPVKSSLGGNADIWDRDNAIGDGGEVDNFTSKPYPIEEAAGDLTPSVSISNLLLRTIIVEMEEEAGDITATIGITAVTLFGPIEESAGDMEPGISAITKIALSDFFVEEAGDVEPGVASINHVKFSVGTSVYVDENEEDVEPAVAITGVTLNA